MGGVPAGTILHTAAAHPPAGFIKADGAELDREVYHKMFAEIGTIYGEGDGVTTFNAPDLRGEFLRCWDDGRGVDVDRELGSWQEDAIRNITGELGTLAHDPPNCNKGAFSPNTKRMTVSGVQGSWCGHDVVYFDASLDVPTADENRPRNVALLACIKY